MKRSIIVCCALALYGAGFTFASVPTKLPEKARLSAAAAGSAKALLVTAEAKSLGMAQDHAVNNYKHNKGRVAAAAKRERAKVAGGAAVRKKQAKFPAAGAAGKTEAGASREHDAKALISAQDRAVANYKRNESRGVAAAKREQATVAAGAARAAEQVRKETQALARAQDRVVAFYKRSLGIGRDTVAAGAVKRIEKLACFTGIQDRHARIGVQLVDGEVDYFAYYSKWKPRTCSIAAERNGSYSHWEENGGILKVTLADDKGAFMIDRKGGAFHFVFQNIDRMRYCGMSGKINGSLTVVRGKTTCVVEGVMDGHDG